MKHYYVSAIVVTMANPAYYQIMEEVDGKQVCIATVPFNKAINPALGREPARKDADLIVRALNFYQQHVLDEGESDEQSTE